MENTLCIKATIGDEDYGLGPALPYRWTGKKAPNKSDTVCVRTPHGETTAIVCDIFFAFPMEARRLQTAYEFQ